MVDENGRQASLCLPQVSIVNQRAGHDDTGQALLFEGIKQFAFPVRVPVKTANEQIMFFADGNLFDSGQNTHIERIAKIRQRDADGRDRLPQQGSSGLTGNITHFLGQILNRRAG